MRILAITQKHSGVGYHRIMMPLTYMQKDYCLITDQINDKVLEKGFDIVVINRMLSGISPEQIADWKAKYNFKLVIDNDDFWNLDVTHPLYLRYQLNNIPEIIKNYIRIADVCTCTHDRLADEIFKYNVDVHILPNALPYGEEQFLDKKIPSNKVRFFWSGSDTHEEDLKILKEPVKRFKQLECKMVMAGYVENDIWNTMAFYFSAGRKLDTQIYRYNEVTSYMSAYGDSDISLIPLKDTYFNSMKSNLKVLETASKKNPAIVSHVNPYLDLPVLYVKKQSDWFKHARSLANDKDLRESLGQKLYDYCNANYNLHLINSKRLDIYKKLL